MGGIGQFFADWLQAEPIAGLWLLVTSVLLFGDTFARWHGKARQIWLTINRLTGSLLVSLSYIGISILFYGFLHSSFKAFQGIYSIYPPRGSSQEIAWRDAVGGWGNGVVQDELSVAQFTETVEINEINGPGEATLYENRMIEEQVPQDSVVGFRGFVEIRREDRASDDPLFRAYRLTARYEYDIANQSDVETRADFVFPIMPDHVFENVNVTLDGHKIEILEVYGGDISWQLPMQPGQRNLITVEYTARGMGDFVYNVNEQEIVDDFRLTVWANTPAIYSSVSPEVEGIQGDNRISDGARTMTWLIDRAIVSPRFLVYLGGAESLSGGSDLVLRMVRYSPRALVLLSAMIVLTLLVCRIHVEIRSLLLLEAAFCLPALGLMGSNIWLKHPWISMTFFSFISLVVSYFTLRKLSRLPLISVLVWVAFFTMGFSCAGLLTEGPVRNSFDVIVLAVLLLYVFGLSLYIRIRKHAT